jgi:redox-sensitive bicupin YhaK (pirin superfamily)
MTAGRGIVHSERETFEVRANPHHIDGLQCWVALPENMTHLSPSFQHVKKSELPHLIHEGVMMRLILGEAFGLSAPLKTYSPMFYLDIAACSGSVVQRPNPSHECAAYVIDGSIKLGDSTFSKGDFVLFEENDHLMSFEQSGRVVVLGGEKFENVPYLTWNFVAYERETINAAIEAWRAQTFPKIPDDNSEYIEY